MDQIREELGRVEKITKNLDAMQIYNDRIKSKWRGEEL